MEKQDIHEVVRKGYADIARESNSCCGGGRNIVKQSACGCGAGTDMAGSISKRIGYSDEEIKEVPEGANLGLGCGNPIALASLKPGEVVLDLGSGAGFDCFLASSRVGSKGKVIGVDMTPEMLDRARVNARKGDYQNVEFRLGEIENLPLADRSVDVIISNCVINLSEDKKKVFQEAFRVLKPSGRLMVSDIVVLKKLPDYIKQSIAAYIGCLSGAIIKDEYLKDIEAAGFKDVKVVHEAFFPLDDMAHDPTAKVLMENMDITPEQVKAIANSVSSIKVSAVKPDQAG
jgi:arsenite methyltransferase